MNPELSLLDNAAQLGALLQAGIITDRQGNPLEFASGLEHLRALLLALLQRRRKIFVIGNGGSAAVASHVAIDLLNKAGCSASTLHDPPTLTCLANDYGYENAMAHAIEIMVAPDDLVIAISSSGRSPNILNAAAAARQAQSRLLTFSGFDQDNPLRHLGDLNCWLPSHDYGLVEIGHLFILHYLAEATARSVTANQANRHHEPVA